MFDELRNPAVAALALPDFRIAAKTWEGWPEGSSCLDFDPVALRQYARAVELSPPNQTYWYHLAAVLLWRGDRDGHRKHCQELLRRFGQSTDPLVVERTAKACLIVPGTVADHSPLVRLTGQALIGTKKHWAYPWFVQARALAECRAGRPAKAIAWIQMGRQQFKATLAHYRALNKLILSLADHQLKEGEKARQALDEAVQIIDHELPKERSGDLGADWLDWVYCHVLRREAEGLLKTK